MPGANILPVRKNQNIECHDYSNYSNKYLEHLSNFDPPRGVYKKGAFIRGSRLFKTSDFPKSVLFQYINYLQNKS